MKIKEFIEEQKPFIGLNNLFKLFCSIKFLIVSFVILLTIINSFFIWLPYIVIQNITSQLAVNNLNSELSGRIKEFLNGYLVISRICVDNIENEWRTKRLTNNRIGTNSSSLDLYPLYKEKRSFNNYITSLGFALKDYNGQNSTMFSFETQPNGKTIYWHQNYETGSTMYAYNIDDTTGEIIWNKTIASVRNWKSHTRPYFANVYQKCNKSICSHGTYLSFNIDVSTITGGFGKQLWENSETVGVAFCQFRYDDLKQFIQELIIPNQGYIVISEENGDLITSNRPEIKLDKQITLQGELEKVITIRKKVQNIEFDDLGSFLFLFFNYFQQPYDSKNNTFYSLSNEDLFGVFGKYMIYMTSLRIDNLNWKIFIIQNSFSVYLSSLIASSISVGTLLCLVFFASVIASIFTTFISKPISNLVKVINLVENMDLDKIKGKINKKSFFYYEIKELLDKFMFMIYELRHYRAFLPQKLLKKKFDLYTKSSTTRTFISSELSSMSRSFSSKSSSEVPSDFSENVIYKHETEKINKFSVGLTESQLLVVLVTYTLKSQKELEDFLGTLFLVFKKDCIICDYDDTSSTFIFQKLSSIVLDCVITLMSKDWSNYCLSINCFLAHGSASTGNLGSKKMKRYIARGEVFDIAKKRSRESLIKEVGICIDESVLNFDRKLKLLKNFEMRKIDDFCYQLGNEIPQTKAMEWIYELEEKKKLFKWKTFNESIKKYDKSKFEAAIKKMREYLSEENNEDDLVALLWLKRFRKKAKEQVTLTI